MSCVVFVDNKPDKTWMLKWIKNVFDLCRVVKNWLKEVFVVCFGYD